LALLAVVAIVTAFGMSGCGPSVGWPTVKPVAGPTSSASTDDLGLLPGDTPAVVAGPDLGEAWTTGPDPTTFITLPDGARVAPDQYLIMLDPSATQGDAEEIANWIGGTIGGHVAYIGLWKVLVDPEPDPAAFLSRLDALTLLDGVLAAAPVGVETVDAGPCAQALADPAYTTSKSKSYEMIHVEDAWNALYASGLPLGMVHVGFLDTILTKDPSGKIPWEFDDVTFANDPATTPDPRPPTADKPATDGFHHADGTLGILAGSGQNGGIAGIASPLGSRLVISTDVLASEVAKKQPGDTPPPQWTSKDGTSYTDASLVSTLREIESGATIISGSYGAALGPRNAAWAAMWKKFVTQMAKDHPNVLFVYSAGNDGTPLDGTNSSPGGVASANVITVGNVDNDGTRDSTSNFAEPGSGGEVTLGAPGERAVWGTGVDKHVRSFGGGTSSAAPMVTATAALIRSIDPKLTAVEIKKIIADTAGPGDAGLGGKTLRVDLAVRAAIDQARAKLSPPLGPLTKAEIDAATKYCTIDVTAGIKERLTTPVVAVRWEIRASLAAIGGPTSISLVVSELHLPNTRQTVTATGQAASWTFLVDKSGASATVTRLDNGFWVKRTLDDKGVVTPSPSASPSPTPQPTWDCSNPPTDPIDYQRWYIHCRKTGG
jgi:hypothetical protein